MNRLFFYTRNFLTSLVPKFFYEKRFQTYLNKTKVSNDILQRVNYYNNLNEKFLTNNSTDTYLDFKKRKLSSVYYYDFRNRWRYFPKSVQLDYQFGDICHHPEKPTFVKSRPIKQEHSCGVILKWNTVRHWNIAKDTKSFHNKKNLAVFRGACYLKKRKDFLKATFNFKNTDIGDTRRNQDTDSPYFKPYMSIQDQLRYKFILSVEGNDVATNLKWILSSQSLCFMAKPEFETWLMEGTLEPETHYVQLLSDYSDLEDKIDYYSRNSDAALKIIKNANQFMEKFSDPEKEKLIELLVIQKYLILSGQCDATETHQTLWRNQSQ